MGFFYLFTALVGSNFQVSYLAQGKFSIIPCGYISVECYGYRQFISRSYSNTRCDCGRCYDVYSQAAMEGDVA